MTCRYCDDTGQYPPPGVGMGDVFPEPCPMGCPPGGWDEEDDDDEH